MKRGRTSSKTGTGDASSKEEPPKKVKKRVKQAAPLNATAATTAAIVATPPSTPSSVITTPALSLFVPEKETKLGSLPLYGEQLPPGKYDDIPGAAKHTCAQLKEVLTKVRDLKKSGSASEDEKVQSEIAGYRQKGLVMFAGLKKLNRLSHLYCKDAREQTHEQKLEVDDIHLQLQNLVYESMHLKREIKNCLEFKSQHEEIDLISEQEMYDSAPKSISKPEVTKKDEHQLMLSRLEWELEQRKQLAEQRGDLDKNIGQQQSEISKMEDNLSGLQPTLESIRKATLPLQESLGLPLDKRRTENETAQLLPPPLYIFFMQIRTYADVQDPSISVSISGDVDEAKAFRSSSSQEQSDEDSGDSDNEAEEQRKKKRRHKRSSKSKETKERPSTPYPLAINVTITVNDLGSFQVTLTYLPFFGAICASVSSLNLTDIPESEATTLIEKSSLLHCLFEGDTGRTSPNSLVSYHIRKRGGDIFSSAVRQYGFPYKWVQRVCGIADNVESPETKATEWQVETSAESIEGVIKVIKRRFKCQARLSRQLVKLSKDDHTMDLGPDGEEQFPDPPSSQLYRWKSLSLSEVQTTQLFSGVSVINQQEKTNRFFLATFQLNEARLHALVCVGVDYPTTPPCIAVVTEVKGQRESRGIQTKNIEAEVNLSYPKTIKGDKHGRYLLCRQLRRLQECFEMYIEHKNASAKQKSKLVHKIKGRGRLLCFTDTP